MTLLISLSLIVICLYLIADVSLPGRNGELLKKLGANIDVPGLLVIDTPGHAVFTNLRNRGGSAADISILVVDSMKGIEVQTLESIEILKKRKVPFIIALNKLDTVPGWRHSDNDFTHSLNNIDNFAIENLDSRIYNVVGDLSRLGIQSEAYYRLKDPTKEVAIVPVSAKTGEGINEILKAIVERIPAPKNKLNDELKALIFDSVYNPFRGIEIYFRVFSGKITKGQEIKFFATNKSYYADEVGTLGLSQKPKREISCGDVGYLITGIKNAKDVKVGDTIIDSKSTLSNPISGFEDVKPMVFAGIYPVDSDDYEDLRSSMEKLQLNDASLVFSPENSSALGFGFRCGFLGMLHLEIIQERLEREFNMAVITTVPNVSYHAFNKKNPEDIIIVNTPSDLPESSRLDRVEEPFIKASIITKADFVGPVMSLCIEKRGEIKNQTYLTTERVELIFDMPLAEIVFDFYDRLKSISKGYASFDYAPIGLKQSKLIKLDILLNNNSVDALSALIHYDNAYSMGKKICEKLKELIPRQQFDIPIQAAIGAKIIARETIKAVRKDVTAKCYGGDITRKRKLLERQKKGKKKMRQIGNVEIPQQAFMAVLKLND